MKAAIVKAPKSLPVYGDFDEPVAREGQTIVHVKASALTQLTKSRASGSHYSSDAAFPAIAGTDGGILLCEQFTFKEGKIAEVRLYFYDYDKQPVHQLIEQAGKASAVENPVHS